jgi:hypothetical protein
MTVALGDEEPTEDGTKVTIMDTSAAKRKHAEAL